MNATIMVVWKDNEGNDVVTINSPMEDFHDAILEAIQAYVKKANADGTISVRLNPEEHG